MTEIDYLRPVHVFGPEQPPTFTVMKGRRMLVDLDRVIVAKTYPCNVIDEGESEPHSATCLELTFEKNVVVNTLYKDGIMAMLGPSNSTYLNDMLDFHRKDDYQAPNGPVYIETPSTNKTTRKYGTEILCSQKTSN